MTKSYDKSTTCCFTGHRPDKFPFRISDGSYAHELLVKCLYEEIEKAISRGYNHFIAGMSLGMDLWAADVVIKLKEKYGQITLEAAIPCAEQTVNWTEDEILHYNRVLESCDKKGIVTNLSGGKAMLARNRYMVDNSSLVIAALDPKSHPVRGGTRATVNYAIKSQVEVINILDGYHISFGYVAF